MPELVLEGCTPEPLMSYLKALGILRLVTEQADSQARACWRNDLFVLQSSLDRQGLIDFFLNHYRPTPIIGPWAGGSGFFPKDNQKAIKALTAANVSERCSLYREAILAARQILLEEKITTKPKEKEKQKLLRRYRRELTEQVIQWMDAAMVFTMQGQTFAPLLGTGGNDGRLDFSQNFMSRLITIGLHQNNLTPEAGAWLENALFARPISRLPTASVGQFAPGRVGGPNATQGMEGNPTDNPWDFILMMEGTLCLAGAAVRRLDAAYSTRASLPFTVMPSPVGTGATAQADMLPSRGELWLPLWDRPATLAELRTLFGEGRAVVGRRMARNGVEFARAIATLGVDRGIHEFVRLGFLRRSGKAYLATPLDRIQLPSRPRSELSLLQEVDPWLDRFRSACGSKVPSRLLHSLATIDRAVFDLCRHSSRTIFQKVFIALGQAERQLAFSAGKIGDSVVPPVPELSAQWLHESNDASVEFEIAVALAGIYGQKDKIGPLRIHLEPVDWRLGRPRWADQGRSVVWSFADLASNLAAVLERRLMEAQKANCQSLPLASVAPASLEAVSLFLAAHTDDAKIEDLLWAGILVHSDRLRFPSRSDAPPLPRAYALLKLLFLPTPLRLGPMEYFIRPEPRIIPLLCAGRIGQACQIALRRLRASGLMPMPYVRPGSASRDDDWLETDFRSGLLQGLVAMGKRLAAALLIPISTSSAIKLTKLVLRPTGSVETFVPEKEEQNHDD